MTAATPKTNQVYKPRLKREFVDKIAAELKDELGLANLNQVPRLEKIIVNIGLGKAGDDKKLLNVGANTLLKITGQRPIATTARKSIASFKLRQGSKIGLKVTLRGDKMYEFADRLINIVLPRLRDFRGVKVRAFDSRGNYSIGFSDQSVFPELSYEETATSHGLQVIFVMETETVEHARKLLEKFGLPFEKGVANG